MSVELKEFNYCGKTFLTEGVEVDLDSPLKDDPVILWLDDIRDPKNYGYEKATWCKDSSQFLIKILSLVLDEEMDLLEEIHFDNDLGERVEGYDMFLFIEESLHKGSFKNLKKIYVHSSNPSAVHKFMLAARSMKYHFGIDVIRKQY